jgi:hypothetical protein
MLRAGHDLIVKVELLRLIDPVAAYFVRCPFLTIVLGSILRRTLMTLAQGTGVPT